MKKLFLSALIMFSITTFAQQYNTRIIYNQANNSYDVQEFVNGRYNTIKVIEFDKKDMYVRDTPQYNTNQTQKNSNVITPSTVSTPKVDYYVSPAAAVRKYYNF